jgi:4-amino-4-deoxy-L-arabinose transferase-like glycosyltransferase
MRRLTLLLVAVVTTAGALLYATRLGDTPPYLMHDESKFALQSISIASSGRDLAGRLLPIFFTEPEFPAGRDPAVIYLTAVALSWLPVSEASVRLPTALLGVLNIVLVFLLTRRLFGRDWMALVAAAFMALTPLHFIRSRLILSPQTSIPIILAWLLCMAAFSERPTTRRLAVAAAWLGLGAYTYLACVVMMPIYWLVTAWFGYRQFGRRGVVIAAIAFAVPLIPMAAWYVTHPERMSQVVGAYELGNEVAATPAIDAGSDALRKAVRLYWSFFSPEFHFVSGDPSLINSTRLAGLFPLSFAVLIPLGLVQLMRRRNSIDVAIVVGWLTAPVAAVASGAIEMNRILFVIPFGVLAAVYGVEWLLAIKARGATVVAIVLVASVPVQFAGFYRDYMGDYRTRAATAFGGNTRDLFINAIRRTTVNGSQPVYVSRAIPFTDRYWRFYALAEARPDAIERLRAYGPELPAVAPLGTLLACPLGDSDCERLLPGRDGWFPVHVVNELDGTPAFALFEAR